MEKLLLTVAECCELTGLGRSTIYDLLAKKEIASLKIGRARRIEVEALRAWVAGQQADSTEG